MFVETNPKSIRVTFKRVPRKSGVGPGYPATFEPFVEADAPFERSITCTLHPAPCTLHPAPYTLHSAPHTLHRRGGVSCASRPCGISFDGGGGHPGTAYTRIEPFLKATPIKIGSDSSPFSWESTCKRCRRASELPAGWAALWRSRRRRILYESFGFWGLGMEFRGTYVEELGRRL